MEIQDIKSNLNITEVARHLGIEINQRTKRALCPFHNDKNPSPADLGLASLSSSFVVGCNPNLS